MDSQVTDSQSLLSQVVVTLKDTDLEKNGAILRDTFQLQVKDSTSSVIEIKRNDWLLADTCPQATNRCASFKV